MTDLPLLARRSASRALLTGAAVGSGALGLLAGGAAALRSRAQDVQTGPKTVRSAVTVALPRAEAEQRWSADAQAAGVPEGTAVRFVDAPGRRGTEVHASLDADGGRPAHPLAALRGTAPDQRLKDGLRRWKQVAETGEVVRSDGTPDGTSATTQPKQRPAQPVGEEQP